MKQAYLKKTTNLLFVFSLTLFVSSCSSFNLSPYKVPVLQGNIFEEKDIEKISKGLTREQVKFIFGTALIQDPFHSNRWDYYYSVQVGNTKLNEKKLSIFFNKDGLVDSWTIEELESIN